MDLTNQTIETTYGNVLTIGSTAGTPTNGTLQNGAGNNLTGLNINGSLNVVDIYVSGASTFSGAISGSTLTSTGNVNGVDGVFSGLLSGDSLNISTSIVGNDIQAGFADIADIVGKTLDNNSVTTLSVTTNDLLVNNNADVGSTLTANIVNASDITSTDIVSTSITATNADIETLTVENIVYRQTSLNANGSTLADATQLSGGIYLVDSPSASDIAVKLPSPLLGTSVKIINVSTVDIEVYPYSATDSVVGLTAGNPYIVPADGLMYEFICVQNPSVGVWSVTTPKSNNSVTRTVSVKLVADGTNIGYNGETWSAPQLMDLTNTTYYVNNLPVYVLNAPSSDVDYFDAPEFNTYNNVRLSKLIIKSNVPAGDLTLSPSQVSSTLMGITSTQLYNCFGYIRTSTRDGATVYNMNDFQTVRFLDYYSSMVAVGSSTQEFGHYMGGDGNLYQKFEISLPSNPNWPIKDSNGVRNIYFSPYIGYGNAAANTPYTGYPVGFSFEAEVIVEFEFSM